MWRLIIDPPLDGATNMARDEALLVLHARGTAAPTLRLYGWAPACLSLGRFQRSGEIDRERCEAEGVAVVRRPSGGRALLHERELTYALVARDDSALGAGSISESYRRISAGLLAGLAHLGAYAALAPREDRRKAKDEPQTAACYDSPAAYELVVDGRKLVGSAQKRHGGALLQHGALPFAPHAERLSRLLHRPPPDLAARMLTLDQVLGRAVYFDEVAEALVNGCAATWNVSFERAGWTDEELALAEELRAARYTTEAWTWER